MAKALGLKIPVFDAIVTSCRKIEKTPEQVIN